MLSEDLSANTCLVSFELMVPPERAPMILFPCGHTFCASCLNKTLQSSADRCAYCRTTIQYKTVSAHHWSWRWVRFRLFCSQVNHSLQSMIEGFVDKRQRLDGNGTKALEGQSPVGIPHREACLLANTIKPNIRRTASGRRSCRGEAFDARGRLQKCTAAAASSKKALKCLKQEKIEVNPK